MSDTLRCRDIIHRVGQTVIDDILVAQYICDLPLDRPQDMKITISKPNPELYKLHRNICRADYAIFEDAAYQLQEDLQKG